MKLLAIDTATEACSAALYIDGNISDRYKIASRKHAELILTMVDQLLAKAEIKLQVLDALVFGCGPGAFTGVRIATGVIQGLAFASDLPVIPVSTLATLAQGAVAESDFIISAIDARMSEIYWGLFEVNENKLVQHINKESVSKPDQISVPVSTSWYGVGSGWTTYQEILCRKISHNLEGFCDDRYPHAKDMIPLAIREFELNRTVSAENALPVYLRNNVTQ